MTYQLFAWGNPLLDIQYRDDGTILKKYGLKDNDAILVEEHQAGIYDDIVSTGNVVYVAGGAAQNAARGAAFILPKGSVVYVGSVGNDNLRKQLIAANEKEGLATEYQVNNEIDTGACAVIITNNHRSLVTKLAAAEKFNKDHLNTPAVKNAIEKAQYFYFEGYFLTHGIESTLLIAKQVAEAKKTLIMNLSAPFIPEFFAKQVDEILPYADIVLGNEAEAEAYARSHSLPSSTAADVAKAIAMTPKIDSSKPRIVIITQGPEETVVAIGEEIRTFPVDRVPDDQIIDTNGAGDAFAGGFLGAYISEKGLNGSVIAGQRLAKICIQREGPTYGERTDILQGL